MCPVLHGWLIGKTNKYKYEYEFEYMTASSLKIIYHAFFHSAMSYAIIYLFIYIFHLP